VKAKEVDELRAQLEGATALAQQVPALKQQVSVCQVPSRVFVLKKKSRSRETGLFPKTDVTILRVLLQCPP